MTPAEMLRQFFYACHRAEGTAAIAYGDREGNFPDIRKEQDIPKTAEEENHIFNLGVAQGIRCLLTELSKEGYTLRDVCGNNITNGVHDLGERFEIWLSMPDRPALRVVGKQHVSGQTVKRTPTGYESSGGK